MVSHTPAVFLLHCLYLLSYNSHQTDVWLNKDTTLFICRRGIQCTRPVKEQRAPWTTCWTTVTVGCNCVNRVFVRGSVTQSRTRCWLRLLLHRRWLRRQIRRGTDKWLPETKVHTETWWWIQRHTHLNVMNRGSKDRGRPPCTRCEALRGKCVCDFGLYE